MHENISTVLSFFQWSSLQMYDDELYSRDAHNVEGEMTVGPTRQNANIGEPDFNTLDEPIKDTIVRIRNIIIVFQFLLILVLLN